MTRKLLMLSTVALGLTPAIALAGGEVVVPPAPPPAPVPVAPVAPPPTPAPVAEVDEGGPYVALYGGASWLQDSDAGFDTDDLAFDDDEAEVEFDTGWIAGAAVGYQADLFGFEPRLELDGAYRQHDVDGGTFGALDFDDDDVDGDVRAVSGLVNAWFDFPVGALAPYVGGGVGAAWIDADDVTVGTGVDIDDNDVAFAWQLGAGVGYDLTPSWTATVDYRWFNAENVGLEDDGDKLGLDYETHNVMAGLRYTF